MSERRIVSYEFGNFHLDIGARQLRRNSEVLPLTHKAFQVLLLLVQNSGQTIEKEKIFNELWANSFVEDANLTQHIYMLRKALGQDPDGEAYIETVARTGYRFTAQVTSIYAPRANANVANGHRPANTAQVHSGPLASPHLRLATSSWPAESEVRPAVERAAETEILSRRTSKLLIYGVVGVALAGLMLIVAIYFSDRRVPQGRATPSVAVLPFRPIGDDSASGKLGLGMADSIITRLSRVRQIPVRPTSAVFKYCDNPAVSSTAAGLELGVDTVLEGTIQRDNDRLRVSVQLIDVPTGKTMWAENFDENYTHLFSMQDSISSKVVAALEVSLTPQQETLLAQHATSSPEASQAYMMGVYYYNLRSKEALTKAADYFSQAIAIDPSYAKALALLADTYNMLRYYRYADPGEMHDKALIAATKALELNASLPEAYVALAFLQRGESGRAHAKQMLEKAIELSPYNSNARIRYGWIVVDDDLAAGVEQMRLAREFDPMSGTTNGAYCNMLLLDKRPAEAVPFCEKAVELTPQAPVVRSLLADAYFYAGRPDDAIAQIRIRIAEADGNDKLSARGTLAFYYTTLGREQEEVNAIQAELIANLKQHPYLLIDLTLIEYAAGRTDEGFRYFQSAVERRLVQAPMLKYYPPWAEVWNDKRVRELWANRNAAPAR